LLAIVYSHIFLEYYNTNLVELT